MQIDSPSSFFCQEGRCCIIRRMGKLIFLVALIGCGCLFMQRCSRSRARDDSFNGTWKIEDENGITGAKFAQTVVVTADKKKFRIVSQGRRGDETTVYDGEMLHQKVTYH